MRKLNVSDADIERVIKCKLGAKNVNVQDLFIQRSRHGTFIRCDVAIEPVKGKF